MTQRYESLALLNCSMDSWFYDGAVAKLVNKGTLGGTVQLGDGVTPATFPTQVFPHGMRYATGSASRLITPANAALSFGDGAGNDRPFSVEILFSRVTSANQILLGGKLSTWNAPTEYALCLIGNLLYAMVFSAPGIVVPGGNYLARTAALPAPGMVNHCVMAYDASKVSTGILLYANGSALVTVNASSGAYIGMTDYGLGVQLGFCTGLMASMLNEHVYNFAIYPFALQPGEVAQLYRARLGLLNRGAG